MSKGMKAVLFFWLIGLLGFGFIFFVGWMSEKHGAEWLFLIFIPVICFTSWAVYITGNE